MFYPETLSDLPAIWRFFESSVTHRGKYFFQEITLNVGYKVRRPNNQNPFRVFMSVDKKVTLNQMVNPRMFTPYGLESEGFGEPEKGPVLCMNKYLYLESCLSRSPKIYTVCSADLSQENV